MLSVVRWVALVAASLIHIASASTFVVNKQEYRWLNSNPVVDVAIVSQRGPLEFIDGQLNPQGYAPELLSHVANLSQITLRYRPYDSLADAILALQQGRVDMLASGPQHRRLSPFVHYARPTVGQPIALFNLLDAPRITQLESLSGRVVAVVEGSAAQERLFVQFPDIKVHSFSNVQQALGAVVTGEAQAVLGGSDEVNQRLRSNLQWRFQQSLELAEPEYHRFAVADEHEILLNLLNRGIATLPDSHFEQRYDYWLSQNPTQETGMTLPVTRIIMVLCSILALILIWLFNRRSLRRQRAHSQSLEAQLEHWKTHDDSTGLPNRHMLTQMLEDHLVAAKPISVLMFDFPRQEEIYENFGQRLGEAAKEAYAKRVNMRIKQRYPDATLAFWHHHYFVVLLPAVLEEDKLQSLSKLIIQTCRGWLRLEQLQLLTRCHVGYASYNPQTEALSADVLLGHAYIALSHAVKHESSVCAYHSSLSQTGMMRLTLESRLRKAIENDELTLYLQPQFCLDSRRLIGAEVLVRWFTASGSISPAEFVPVAEETGLVLQLDRWVFERSMQLLARLSQRLPADFKLSVNFSASTVSLGHAERIAISYAKKWQINPQRVCIEITESAMMEQPSEAKSSIQRMRNAGFGIAIDDFGTGYSSMAYLKHLPVTLLKIDRAFISEIDENISDQHIVKAMVMIAKSMNYKVLIEGVETQAQANLAAVIGCEWAQGFLFSKPISERDFASRYLNDAALESNAKRLTSVQ